MRRAAALLCIALAAPASAAGASVPRLAHAGRWLTDVNGRVVILHGLNEVYKFAPYYPSAAGFGDDDAAFLARQGFNVVRVGVIWKALEPAPGVYNDAYLSHIAQTVATLARHGVLSLLDFHQDLMNERFQGEGAPDWAIQDDGLPNPKRGFPGNYLFNDALERALDHFWHNDPGPGGVGLQERYAAAWAHVAARFKNVPGVLGYELYNEPFPGSVWASCASIAGCPAFDALLSAFNQRVDMAIRGVDQRTLLFYEPNVLFNAGVSEYLAPLGDPRAVFAFHDYCLAAIATGPNASCNVPDNRVFVNADLHATRTGDGLLETEFGATDALPFMLTMANRADRFMDGWIEWAYTGNDITTSGSGNVQALVINPNKPPVGSNVKQRKLLVLARPYPQAVAGTPLAYSFDAQSGRFTLRFSTKRASGHGRFSSLAETLVELPAIQYPSGYTVSVSGGAVRSAPSATLLRLRALPGASQVSLTVRRRSRW